MTTAANWRNVQLTTAGHIALGDHRPNLLRDVATDLRAHHAQRLAAAVAPQHLAALLDHAVERWSALSPGERALICRLAGVDPHFGDGGVLRHPLGGERP